MMGPPDEGDASAHTRSAAVRSVLLALIVSPMAVVAAEDRPESRTLSVARPCAAPALVARRGRRVQEGLAVHLVVVAVRDRRRVAGGAGRLRPPGGRPDL